MEGLPNKKKTFSWSSTTFNVTVTHQLWFVVKEFLVPFNGDDTLIQMACGNAMFNAGDVAFLDIAIDGRRLSGGNNGFATRTEVSSGRGTLRPEVVVKGLSGMHRVAIMARCNSLSSTWGVTASLDQFIYLNTSSFTRSPGMYGLPSKRTILRPHEIDDQCNVADPVWTARNMTFASDGTKLTGQYDAIGDALLRPFIDNGQDFGILAHVGGFNSYSGILGTVALNSAGTGFVCATYDSPFQSWIDGITAYARDGVRISAITNTTPAAADHWQHMRRVGNVWSWRWSLDTAGYSWSPWTPTYTEAVNVTQVGILRSFHVAANIPLWVERFIVGSPETLVLRGVAPIEFKYGRPR